MFEKYSYLVYRYTSPSIMLCSQKFRKDDEGILWEGVGVSRKDHLTGSNKFKLSIEVRGIGCRGFDGKNMALLGKWLFRYAHKSNFVPLDYSK